jgi:uncharacterized OB-fold protein
MSEYLRPLPAPDPQSAPFWQGCREHRLLVQRCTSCGTHRYPPRPVCPKCRSRSLDWAASTGRGTVFSWITVVHPVPKEVYGKDVPYVVALIALDEGVRIASNIVGCEPSAIVAGMPVEVVFDDVTPEVTLPKFRPVPRG